MTAASLSSTAAARTRGAVVRKLLAGQPAIFAFWGDSIEYGFDPTATGISPAINGQAAAATRSARQSPETFAQVVGQIFPGQVTVLNRGVPGNTIGAVLARLQADATPRDVSFFNPGINDAWNAQVATDLDTYLANYQAALALEQSRGVLPIVLLPTPLQGYPANSTIQTCAMAVRQLCREMDVEWVDTATQLESIPGVKWCDGTHGTATFYAERGWHLAALFVASGGAGGPKPAVPGRTLWPEDFFGPNLVYQPMPGVGHGSFAELSATAHLGFECLGDVAPIVTTYNDTPGQVSTLTIGYAAGVTGQAPLVCSHLGNAAAPRRRWRGPTLKRGYRVLSLTASDTTPMLIESIQFVPATGARLLAAQGTLRKSALAGIVFPSDNTDVLGAFDYELCLTPPFRIVADVCLPTGILGGVGLAIAGDMNQGAGGGQTATKFEALRNNETAMLLRTFLNGWLAFSVSVPSVFTAGRDFCGLVEIAVSDVMRVYVNGVQAGADLPKPAFAICYPGLIAYGAPKGFACGACVIRS